MAFKIGEVVYSEKEEDFFSIVNVGPGWVYGTWHKGSILGVKENINIFRKTCLYEYSEKTKREGVKCHI